MVPEAPRRRRGRREVPGRASVPEEAPPVMLQGLSRAWGRFGRSRAGRWLLQASVTPLARIWLRTGVVPDLRAGPDDVTVLIGVRNRSDYRLENALRSLRAQSHPTEIVVVDYGSGAEAARFLADACRRHRARYQRVEASGPWSRGRCLNAGLRLVRTTFTLVSDADIVFSPRYITDAVQILRASPLSVVCSSMLDLPEAATETLRSSAERTVPLDFEDLRRQGSRRLNRDLHSSIAMTYTPFFRLIRGYDEAYEGWGREDADLMRRLRALGLRPTAVHPSSCYLHQWHSRFEGLSEDEHTRTLETNTVHFRAHRSILRNPEGWGRGGS